MIYSDSCNVHVTTELFHLWFTQSDNFEVEANLLDASQESVDKQPLTAPVRLENKW